MPNHNPRFFCFVLLITFNRVTQACQYVEKLNGKSLLPRNVFGVRTFVWAAEARRGARLLRVEIEHLHEGGLQRGTNRPANNGRAAVTVRCIENDVVDSPAERALQRHATPHRATVEGASGAVCSTYAGGAGRGKGPSLARYL